MPPVVLKSNSQYGPQDPQSQEARSSWEPSSDSKSYGETCNNTVDHRISGVPLSAVEPQNTTRENKVKRLIEKFERKELHLMLYYRIALGKHIYVATRAERIQNSKYWILTINEEGGTQQSLNQRPDFAQAKRESKRLHDEHLARTQEEYRAILRSQQVRQRKEQQFEGIEEYDYAVDP